MHVRSGKELMTNQGDLHPTDLKVKDNLQMSEEVPAREKLRQKKNIRVGRKVGRRKEVGAREILYPLYRLRALGHPDNLHMMVWSNCFKQLPL